MHKKLLFTFTMLIMLLVSCQPFGSQGAAPIVPPEGWTNIKSEQVSIWLPPQYQGYKTLAAIDQRIAELRAAGPEYASDADILAYNRLHVDLIASDTHWQGKGCAPGVQIYHNDPAADAVELNDKVLQQMIDSLQTTNRVRVLEHAMVRFDRFGAGRIVLEYPNTCLKGVAYIVPWGRNYWYVIFLASANDFDRQLDSFEQSIRTFEVLPQANP